MSPNANAQVVDPMTVEQINEKLEQHLEDCEQKEQRQDDLYEKTMEAIEKLTHSTQGVVDAWVFANMFHKFVRWASGFSVLAVAGVFLYDKFKG
jgi:hypothetical protein